MIDWWGLFHNALWLAGLSLALATVSVASYQAATSGTRLWQTLARPGFQKGLLLGLALACLGWLLGDDPWWSRVIWGLLAVYFAASAALLWRSDRQGAID